MHEIDSASPLRVVLDAAEEAGYKHVLYDQATDQLEIPIKLEDGRHQRVFICKGGRTPRGDSLITVFSACRVLTSEEVSHGQDVLYSQLLRRSWELRYGKFALAPHEDDWIIVICCEQLVPTLDAAELDALIQYVAKNADEYEAELGKDEF